MKTLYISDLDGTLLTPDACLSERSTQLLQQLSAEGVFFSCATARSIVSVRSILSRVQMPMPVVLMNGVCIYDMHARQYLHYETIGVQTALQVTEILEQMQVPAFLYTIEGQELGCFHHRLDDPVMEAYRAARPQRFDRPFTQVDSLTQAVSDRTIYITMVDQKDRIQKIRDAVVHLPGLQYAFYKDVYDRDSWYLELCGAGASKRQAVDYLRHAYGFAHIIGFGDNLNDLSLFAGCDECYAVANARDEVKAAATGVIGSNLEDAVPEWILEHYYHNQKG